MDAALRQLLDRLYRESRAHDAAQADRLARYRNVEPETATLLAVLVRRARANLQAAGLDARLRTQDATDALAQSPDGAYDFVFLDAERPAYAALWPQLVRTLAPRGLLAVDNVLSHEHELVEFTALVPVGAGLRLAVRA